MDKEKKETEKKDRRQSIGGKKNQSWRREELKMESKKTTKKGRFYFPPLSLVFALGKLAPTHPTLFPFCWFTSQLPRAKCFSYQTGWRLTTGSNNEKRIVCMGEERRRDERRGYNIKGRQRCNNKITISMQHTFTHQGERERKRDRQIKEIYRWKGGVKEEIAYPLCWLIYCMYRYPVTCCVEWGIG